MCLLWRSSNTLAELGGADVSLQRKQQSRLLGPPKSPLTRLGLWPGRPLDGQGRGRLFPSAKMLQNSNCKRKRRLLAITYCKIRISLRSPGGPILLVREAEPLVFLLVFAGVGQFHLQFELQNLVNFEGLQ